MADAEEARLEYSVVMYRSIEEVEVLGTQHVLKILAQATRVPEKRWHINLDAAVVTILNSLDKASFQQQKTFYTYER